MKYTALRNCCLIDELCLVAGLAIGKSVRGFGDRTEEKVAAYLLATYLPRRSSDIVVLADDEYHPGGNTAAAVADHYIVLFIR